MTILLGLALFVAIWFAVRSWSKQAVAIIEETEDRERDATVDLVGEIMGAHRRANPTRELYATWEAGVLFLLKRGLPLPLVLSLVEDAWRKALLYDDYEPLEYLSDFANRFRASR